MSCSIKELRKCRAVINELRELSTNVSRGIDKVLNGADPMGLSKLKRPLMEMHFKMISLIANKKGDLKVQSDSTPCDCISLRTQVSDLLSFIAPEKVDAQTEMDLVPSWWASDGSAQTGAASRSRKPVTPCTVVTGGEFSAEADNVRWSEVARKKARPRKKAAADPQAQSPLFVFDYFVCQN